MPSNIYRGIEWFIRAKTIHGLDSPLLYQLHRAVISNDEEIPYSNTIEAIRLKHLANNELIDRLDAGSGSKRLKKATSIQQIAKVAVSNQKKCSLLYRLAKHFNARDILELGASLGISSLYLAASSATVDALDADQKLIHVAQAHQPEWASNLEYRPTYFKEAISAFANSKRTFDFVFIDGGHSKESVLKHLQQLKQITTSDTTFIIDDIYWSADMTDCWQTLLADTSFNLRIDLGYFGILAFNPNLRESVTETILPYDFRWRLGLFR